MKIYFNFKEKTFPISSIILKGKELHVIQEEEKQLVFKCHTCEDTFHFRAKNELFNLAQEIYKGRNMRENCIILNLNVFLNASILPNLIIEDTTENVPLPNFKDRKLRIEEDYAIFYDDKIQIINNLKKSIIAEDVVHILNKDMDACVYTYGNRKLIKDILEESFKRDKIVNFELFALEFNQSYHTKISHIDVKISEYVVAS